MSPCVALHRTERRRPVFRFKEQIVPFNWRLCIEDGAIFGRWDFHGFIAILFIAQLDWIICGVAFKIILPLWFVDKYKMRFWDCIWEEKSARWIWIRLAFLQFSSKLLNFFWWKLFNVQNFFWQVEDDS